MGIPMLKNKTMAKQGQPFISMTGFLYWDGPLVYTAITKKALLIAILKNSERLDNYSQRARSTPVLIAFDSRL